MLCLWTRSCSKWEIRDGLRVHILLRILHTDGFHNFDFFPALGSTVYHGIENTGGLPSGAGNFHLATVGYFRNDASAIFDLSKVDGIVTFPSFHMVMALLIPFALRGTRFMFWIAVLWAFLVTLSTIAIGGHYVIDLLGGAVAWAAAVWWVRSNIRSTSNTIVAGDGRDEAVSLP